MKASGYDRGPMLHRLPASPRAVLTTHRSASSAPRLPVSPLTRQWLFAPGSLTARLRLHGSVQVKVQRQGHQKLWPQEAHALKMRSGHVREVVLTVDGRPAIWARSVTSHRGLKGPWRALKGLGARPLAELLFEHRGVVRSPLHAQRLVSASPQSEHLARQWQGLNSNSARQRQIGLPAWSRRSLFWHKGQALQVMECFAPWILAYSPHHPSRAAVTRNQS